MDPKKFAQYLQYTERGCNIYWHAKIDVGFCASTDGELWAASHSPPHPSRWLVQLAEAAACSVVRKQYA